MRFISMIAGGLIAALMAGVAAAQPAGIETVATFRQEIAVDSRDWMYRDGALYGLERPGGNLPYPHSEKRRLVSLDPMTGKVDVLTDFETTEMGRLLHFTPTRILATSRQTPRLRLFSRQPVEELTDIRLGDSVMDMIERNGELQMLQSGYYSGRSVIIARFNRDDLTYLGAIPLTDAGGLNEAVFHDGGVVGIGRSNNTCPKDMACFFIRRATMRGELVSSIEIKVLVDTPYLCRSDDHGLVESWNLVLFRVGCTLYAVDSKAEKILYTLTLPGPAQGVAIGDDFVFVLSEEKGVKATPQSLPLIPLYVFDRRNGQLMATILRPHGRIAADGDRLIFWRQYGGNAGEVLRFDAKAMRQAARP